MNCILWLGFFVAALGVLCIELRVFPLNCGRKLQPFLYFKTRPLLNWPCWAWIWQFSCLSIPDTRIAAHFTMLGSHVLLICFFPNSSCCWVSASVLVAISMYSYFLWLSVSSSLGSLWGARLLGFQPMPLQTQGLVNAR